MASLISLFALFLTAALVYLIVGNPLIERRSDLETLVRLSKLEEHR
ncbi:MULTISPECIES: hypothetical protein [Nocardiopsis]|nr:MULTISPECIES: hypothetical protein [Nocardiopsis]